MIYLKEADVRNQNFFWIDLASGQERQYHRVSKPALRFVISYIAPDGSRILFDRLRANSDVVLMDRDRRRLTRRLLLLRGGFRAAEIHLAAVGELEVTRAGPREPSFAWKPTTVTFMPAGSELRFHPRRINTEGEPPSLYPPLLMPSILLGEKLTVERLDGTATYPLPGRRGDSMVIVGEPGDNPLLGATTLEGFDLVLNPFRREHRPTKSSLK